MALAGAKKFTIVGNTWYPVDQQSKQRITYRSFALAVAGEHPWLDRASTTM